MWLVHSGLMGVTVESLLCANSALTQLNKTHRFVFFQQITNLKKENFNLKLRIYFMEERAQQKFDSAEDVYKTVTGHSPEIICFLNCILCITYAAKMLSQITVQKNSKIYTFSGLIYWCVFPIKFKFIYYT